MTLTEAIEKYKNYVLVTKSEGTYSYEKSKCSVLNMHLGCIEVDKIDNDIILQFIVSHKEYNKKISNASLNKYIATLKRVVKYVSDREIKFGKLKERQKIIPTISKDIIEMIFNNYTNLNRKTEYRNLIFFRLLLDTGLRLNELLNVEVSNIDFNTNSIIVTTTKTNKDRIVFFTDTTAKLLYDYIKKFNLNKHLIIRFKTNEKLNKHAVMCICNRLRDKLNLTQSITPHKWRHTFATNFLKNGGDIESLRLILGHAKLSTTQKYLHLDADYLRIQYLKTQRHTDGKYV